MKFRRQGLPTPKSGEGTPANDSSSARLQPRANFCPRWRQTLSRTGSSKSAFYCHSRRQRSRTTPAVNRFHAKQGSTLTLE